MAIQNDLKELLEKNIITPEVAGNIENYYNHKSGSNQNRLLIAFGLLGAVLIGLGIILMIAHNWDSFNRTTKTAISFFPLLIGQALCFYALRKKSESTSWIESSSVFLFFSIGANMALVSQIYHLDGEIASFLLTWMLISIPIILVMNSKATSLLFLGGITWFACEAGYAYNSQTSVLWYWPLFALAILFYYKNWKKNPQSNFILFQNWLLPLSLLICVGTLEQEMALGFSFIYVMLFANFSLLGDLPWMQRKNLWSSGYLILGSLGTTVMLFIFSFSDFWQEIRRVDFDKAWFTSPEIYFAILLLLTAFIALKELSKTLRIQEMRPSSWVFVPLTIIFVIGFYSPIAVVLDNIVLLGYGIAMVLSGAKRNHLGILNYGLNIIAILVVCRFFDTDLSFVIRGMLFILVGAGFFVANYRMIKKRRTHDN